MQNMINTHRQKSNDGHSHRNLNSRVTHAVSEKLLASVIEAGNPLKNDALKEFSFPKTLEFFPLREYNESL